MMECLSSRQVRVQPPATTRRTRVSLQPTAVLQARRLMAATAARFTTSKSCSAQEHPMQLLKASSCHQQTGVRRSRGCRTAALPPLAMINVDFASPSLVLGIALIGCGVALLQVRNLQREVSRDADIVVAAMISIVGSTLIFQGWRLDPLLLLCQALTTSVALWYGLETFKLRQQVTGSEEEEDVVGQLPPPQDGMRPMNEPYSTATRSGYLPPTSYDQTPPWTMPQQQQQQPDYSSRWGLPPADQTMQPYGGYLGQTQQQQQQQPEGAFAGYEEQLPAAGPSQQWLPPLQQQQYGVPADYATSSSNGNVYGQLPQQQFDISAARYGQQGSWYGAGAVPSAPEQQLPPGVTAPGVPEIGAAAAMGQPYGPSGVNLLQDGAIGMPGYPADATAPLPLPPASQQQQQAGRGNGSRAGQSSYERVDDWE